MSGSNFDSTPTFFGLSIPTHRTLLLLNNITTNYTSYGVNSTIVGSSDNLDGVLDPYFPYEPLIAAISIIFFRMTVKLHTNEPIILRWLFCIALGILAYTKQSYQLITAVEIFSYTISYLLLTMQQQQYVAVSSSSADNSTTNNNTRKRRLIYIFQRLFLIVFSAFGSMLISHIIFTSTTTSNSVLFQFLYKYIIPSYSIQLLLYLFPITEIYNAYTIMYSLSFEKVFFQSMIYHLFFVTFHIQVGMGFLGIAFLRAEQSRRNQLIRLDVYENETNDNTSNTTTSTSKTTNNESNANTNHINGIKDKTTNSREIQMSEKSKLFQRGAAPFIFLSALPYMAQIIFYGNINHYAYACVQDELHRTIRYRQVFVQDNHLTAIANDSPTSPEAYASSMNTVVSTVYEIFNRKLFSLPKVLLLPSVMSRQPLLIAQVFPFIFISDWVKATAVNYMTTKIEKLQKEINEISSIRSKVESFDIKNAELLQRSGKDATQFTQRRWEKLTVQVQSRQIISDLLGRGKGFFAFMQRNFIFTVLIDCALANLIAIGKIVAAEIFVYSRAIEDAVDMLLMRSRGEAELARMLTEIEKLDNLRKIWENSKKPNHLRCLLDDKPAFSSTGIRHNKIVLRNLHYSRGTAMARADHIELGSGVYALTGANGSGKSTLFRILMSCDTNDKSIELPPSINLLTPAEPLTEEDDVRRQTACLAALDDDDSDESCDTDVNISSRELHPRSSITMPSKHIVEISQTFYWPLYSKPIDWIFQDQRLTNTNESFRQTQIRRVAEALHELQFFQSSQDTNEMIVNSTVAANGNVTIAMDGTIDASLTDDSTSYEWNIQRIMSELVEEKEDWFSDLSGGQKSKVELVRTVFLREKCPDVLLVDETMAPLDPSSKQLVMAKLKNFCSESIIIVIYHTDVGQGKEVEGETCRLCPIQRLLQQEYTFRKRNCSC